jgi:hypothetical protein
VEFFFQEELLLNHKPLLKNGDNRDAVLSADLGNFFDAPVNRNARDLNGFVRQYFPHDLFN